MGAWTVHFREIGQVMSQIKMEGECPHLRDILQLFSLFLCFCCVNSVEKCTTDKGQTLSAWDWEIHGNGDTIYYINLCKKASGCSDGVSICKGGTNFGNKATTTDKIATKTFGNHSFQITFDGAVDNECGKLKKKQTVVVFHCERNLGFPKLIDDRKCLLTFEFNTNEACPTKPTVDQIPCVVYNPTDHIKRDLSPLIKQKGGHLVASSEQGVNILINVCQEITNQDAGSCVASSAACRLNSKPGLGEITEQTKLVYNSTGNIRLTYYGKEVDKKCNAKPNTTITFICTTKFQEGGSGPVLISSPSTCNYEIEWRTDHACPDKDVLTNNCTFSNDAFSVDLTQLEKPLKQESYGVKAEGYVYRIKVCSNGQPCGPDVRGDHTAVCQINVNKYRADASCGDADYRSVRYADGNLTLMYKNGERCGNGINRTTVIMFRCDPKIDIGTPSFVTEEHCYYYFEWPTRIVCSSRKSGTCSVNQMVAKQRLSFDLSILTKTGGSWLALNALSNAAGKTYRINVCGSVSTRYKECDGAAACEIDEQTGNARNIGTYNTPLTVLSSSALQITYTGGECTGFGRLIRTVVKFICKPINLENPPELVLRSWDGCEYLFTWSTAAACSLRVLPGKKCVLDDAMGNVYNLSILSKGPGKGSELDYFTVKRASGQSFKIKICGSLQDSCAGEKSVGVCETSSDGTQHSAGKGNDNLFYYDGKVNLTYSGGTKCHKYGQPARSTHITFFCNETAGVGAPVFDRENYCTYHFIWYTSHVCPAKTVECLMKDSQGREYDLSSLVRTSGKNWLVTHGSTKYYINICRDLSRTSETYGCPRSSAVCVNGTTSLGSVTGPLTMSKDGLLTLRYNAGKYRTIINFICNSVASAPVLNSFSKFAYSFIWKTPAACPVTSHSAGGCSVANAAGESVNIGALTKQGDKVYSLQADIEGEKVTITLNICKKIACGKDANSTVCLTDKKGHTRSLGRYAKSTIEYEGDMIVLTYRGGDFLPGHPDWGLYAVTVINFVCTRNVSIGTPMFRGLEQNVYTFEFRTSLACPAKTVQCFPSGLHQKYNLSPLGLTTGNWFAADTRKHLTYYINVCQAYNPAGMSPACSGRVGACQLDTVHSAAKSMGVVQSSPFVSSSGHLTLRYSGGDLCHKKFPRSTRINFFCSQTHASPVFITEIERNCEYVFNWRTPSACPLVTSTGVECEVYDPQYGVLYNLNGLDKTSSTLTLKNGSTLHVSFCGGKLPKTCAGGDGGAACIEGSTEIFLAKDDNLVYYDDTISMIYKTKSGSTITNRFNCGKDLLSKGQEISSVDSKGIIIQWGTKYACRPVKGEECSVVDEKGNLYDLSVLARDMTNWRARVALDDKEIRQNKYYVSVCEPLGKINNKSSHGSRAIVVTPSGSDKIRSLGTMDKPLSLSKDGYLTMFYSHIDDNSRCSKLSTQLQFVCDIVPEGQRGEPVLDLYNIATCAAHFTWITKAACPVLNQTSATLLKNCTAIHPATMKTIDLRKLYKKDGYDLKDQKGTPYKLNLCGDFNIKGCSSNAGMCRMSDHKSVGWGDNTLHYRQGFLYLSYQHGEKCDKSGSPMETLVSFYCNRTMKDNGEPKLEISHECTHYVTWQTPLACEAEFECVATDGSSFYDLSPLIKNNDNYEVFLAGKRYLINVCRSLVSERIVEKQCSSNAAVCAIDPSYKNGDSVSKYDFGHMTGPPTLTSGNGAKVKLVYSKGGVCPHDKAKTLSTTIEFVCDENADYASVTPIPIMDPDGCSFVIKWNTSLVCDTKPVRGTSCQLYDPKTKFCLDLKKLKGFHQLEMPDIGKVNFDVCGGMADKPPGCKNAEVCLMTSKAKPVAITGRTVSYRGREVQLNYGNRDINVTIFLYCGEDKSGEDKSGKPQYIGKYERSNKVQYVFNWITPIACTPRQASCHLDDGKKIYDLAPLRRYNARTVRDSQDGSTYFINICGNVPYKQSSQCSSHITALRNSSVGDISVIGTDVEQKLYKVQDEDYPLRLEYSSDKMKGCSTAKVVHKFRCANVNQPPQFDRKSSKKCIFVFLWKTYIACPEERRKITQKSPWVFEDPRSAFCDLELGRLKQELQALKETNKCSLATPVLYAEGEYYELDVNCSNPKIKIDITLSCNHNALDGTLVVVDKQSSQLSLEWETNLVCDTIRLRNCFAKNIYMGARTAAIIIGTFLAIGLLAAVIFFVCSKSERRERVALWIRWHARKYICCKKSYQASYRYTKVDTGDDEDGETGFIIETHAGTVFSDDDDDDDDDYDQHNGDDDDELLPWDDDLLKLDD